LNSGATVGVRDRRKIGEALVFATPPIALDASNQAVQQVMAHAAQQADQTDQTDQTVKENMIMESEPQVLVRGKFRDADSVHRGSGDAVLYRLADGSHLLRLENFRVTNGPDLAVYLVKHADPSNLDQVTSGFLNLGKLKGNVGNQN
jgi:hypothetical protein